MQLNNGHENAIDTNSADHGVNIDQKSAIATNSSSDWRNYSVDVISRPQKRYIGYIKLLHAVCNTLLNGTVHIDFHAFFKTNIQLNNAYMDMPIKVELYLSP